MRISMILSILYWYVVISYIIGVVLFFVELPANLVSMAPGIVPFSALMVLVSPLFAWHGALHYVQKWFCQLTGRPVKYWI
jgi:hypothetical protein